MVARRRSVTRAADTRGISLLIPVALFGVIPATALRGLLGNGSVEDALFEVIRRELKRGMGVYESDLRRREK